MKIDDYLGPAPCPRELPPLEIMGEATRSLHQAIDQAIRRQGVPYLHPQDPTIQLDLLGSSRMVAWQEAKAAFLFEGEGCWSELPQVYARYGVETTRGLIGEVRKLEAARAAVLTDSGMQACALLFDRLLQPGGHAICMRQVYNKTRKYLEWLASRVGADVSIVDDGDAGALEEKIRKGTQLIFVETYTNPLLRAADPEALGALALSARKRVAPQLRLVVDNTIASPWGPHAPLLSHPGVDFIVASGTKSLSGQDRDLCGYVASNLVDTMNEVMDLQAMRGGILSWRTAVAVLEGLEVAKTHHARRCEGATEVARFLAGHPAVEAVFHPSRPDHPDACVIGKHYVRHGSLLSFRLRGASEEETRHFCDVLALCVVPRYALSFDGLATKVNHHKSVSEYFTPDEEIALMGIERLVRLGVGLEDPRDIIACLHWALSWHRAVSGEEVSRLQEARARSLGIYQSPGKG